jgi:hypothetical protein
LDTYKKANGFLCQLDRAKFNEQKTVDPSVTKSGVRYRKKVLV